MHLRFQLLHSCSAGQTPLSVNAFLYWPKIQDNMWTYFSLLSLAPPSVSLYRSLIFPSVTCHLYVFRVAMFMAWNGYYHVRWLKAKLLPKCNLGFFCECIWVKPSRKSIITNYWGQAHFLSARCTKASKSRFLKH